MTEFNEVLLEQTASILSDAKTIKGYAEIMHESAQKIDQLETIRSQARYVELTVKAGSTMSVSVGDGEEMCAIIDAAIRAFSKRYDMARKAYLERVENLTGKE